MSFFKRGRFIYWFIQALANKYKRQIFFGLFFGSIFIVILQRLLIPFYASKAKKTEYIGIVGDYTVSTLPDRILHQISYGLTQLDEAGNVLPGLASTWEATDSGKKYIFQINPNLTWHDGTKVTLDDVNYNIKDISVMKTPPTTITYYIPMSYSPFLTVVAKPLFKKGLVGFGQYHVSTLLFKGGTFVTLTLSSANPDKPNKMYKFYKTEDQAILAYKQGEIDRIEDLLSPYEDISKWKNTVVTSNTNYDRMVSLFFNMKDPLLQEKSFRQALAFTIPPINEERADSPISKTSWAYTDAVKQYKFDEKQAKKLFDATKVSTSSGNLTLHTFSPYLSIATKIAQQWTKLGIKTDVKVENTVPPNYQVLLTARDIPKDPDQYAFWHSTQKISNINGYFNPKIDKLLEDGRAEIDSEERLKIYTDFQKRLVDDAPAIFLYYPKTYTVQRR